MLLTSIHSAHSTAFQLMTSENVYENTFKGDWVATTKVTYTTCADVPLNEVRTAKIRFESYGGSLFPKWLVKDWKTIRSKVIDFKPQKVLNWEHESKYTKEFNKYVYVKTVDKLKFTETGILKGVGYHKKIVNGNKDDACVYMTQTYFNRRKTHSKI